MQGLLARKIGMTRVFDRGRQVPVTALVCGPCVVVQRKRKAKEGYDSVQLGFDDIAEKKLLKPEFGPFKKINTAPKRYLAEFAVESDEACKEGDVVTVDLFKDVPFVDVVGMTKGKGFQGVMRRHRMRGGVMTHGGHSKRRVGSVGCRELPGRIHKGKRMPGHMGHVRITQQNLQVVKIMASDNVILVCGAVPGHAGAIVMIRKSLKKGGLKP
jgi:large subunit ribosomal protein L3